MRHSVCRGACEIIVAPGLPVLLEGGEQGARAVGKLVLPSFWSREGLPLPSGRRTTQGVPAPTERPHSSSFFLAFFLHLTVIGRDDEV